MTAFLNTKTRYSVATRIFFTAAEFSSHSSFLFAQYYQVWYKEDSR
jgi:hypothetical protein